MMNQRKLGTILSYVQIIVSNTISLLYTPFMLRMMGKSEYGLYGTANSFISYLSILSLGIGGAYIRFNVQYRARKDWDGEKQLNGMFLVIFSCLSVLVLIGGLLFIGLAGVLVKSSYTPEELYKLRVIMLLLTVNMIITFVCNVIMMALQAYEQFFFIRIVLIIMGIMTPIVNIIALKCGGRAISITLISLLFSCLSYFMFYIYARKFIHLKFSFHGFRKDVIKELFAFSAFLFINSLTDQITFSTDNIVLSSVKGTAATAIYTVGASFKTYFQSFSTSISSVYAPQVNLIIAQNEKMSVLDELFLRVGRIQFYMVSLIIIGYVTIGKNFICLWAGEDYADAYWIGLLLMLAIYIPSFQNLGIEIQKAMNMHRARSIIYFIIALINIILTVPASMKWGGIGASAATMVSMFFGTVVFMNLYYKVKIGLDMYGFWRSILSIMPGFIMPLMFGFYLTYIGFVDSLVHVLLAAVGIAIVFLISVWLFSMNEYEKTLIRRPVMKYFNYSNKGETNAL